MSEPQQFERLLSAGLRGFAPIDSAKVRRLFEHFELLRRWNRRLNLTSVTELSEAVSRHYVESLFLSAHIPPETHSAVDLGSGAGFPGIAVAIVRPDLRVFLVEGDRRKAAFLREAADGLANVTVFAGRADEFSERVDAVLGRAVRIEELIGFARRITTVRVILFLGALSEIPRVALDVGWKHSTQPLPSRTDSGLGVFHVERRD